MTCVGFLGRAWSVVDSIANVDFFNCFGFLTHDPVLQRYERGCDPATGEETKTKRTRSYSSGPATDRSSKRLRPRNRSIKLRLRRLVFQRHLALPAARGRGRVQRHLALPAAARGRLGVHRPSPAWSLFMGYDSRLWDCWTLGGEVDETPRCCLQNNIDVHAPCVDVFQDGFRRDEPIKTLDEHPTCSWPIASSKSRRNSAIGPRHGLHRSGLHAT